MLTTSLRRSRSSGFFRKRSFHFASTEYARCFLNIPQPDTLALREQTITYLDSFDSKLWYDEPMVSLLKGKELGGSAATATMNALGITNGNQMHATAEHVAALKAHIRSFESPYLDLRKEMRAIEQTLFDKYSGFLIGNQCLDFQKQDGITEIEESIMANAVERRLNDLLLADEAQGIVEVNRQPIYVSCVSNFSNFLDLFRKTIRSLEVGVPVIILGRSNTSQHCFRWSQLLVDLMREQAIDLGMATFLCCSLDDIRDVTLSCEDRTGNLYATCSRDLAAEIKSNYRNTVASTGGPNTLVATELTDAVKHAIQTSASIESAGQCTALRHCVVPRKTSDSDLESIFASIDEVDDASQALKGSIFDGVFPKHKGSDSPHESTYNRSRQADAYFKISNSLPSDSINEFWRKVVVDFSKVDVETREGLRDLAAWLNTNQPISLAVNAPRKESIRLGLELFDLTGMVVNTIGSTDDATMPPAMTCQARPQDAEVFGEFPPRASLGKYTRFPVIVPSSTPSYDTRYNQAFLESQPIPASFGVTTRMLLNEVKDPCVVGYCVVLIKYLQDVTRMNPKQGVGRGRTAVYGLQRPPIGTKMIIHCSKSFAWDVVCPIYLLFHVTNARPQVELSIDPANKELADLCAKHSLPFVLETSSEMSDRVMSQPQLVFNVVHVENQPLERFPMVGNFASLYLPLGHIKSTKPNDAEFVLLARLSQKWLNTLF